MNPLPQNAATNRHELKDELARLCLPEANRDPNRKLAWANSICLLFLLVGVLGAKRGAVNLSQPPPLEQVIPTVIEPLTPPPQTETESLNPDQSDENKTETPQVVVVTPESPAISFSVPTIGNVLAPSSLAQPPPLHPMQSPTLLKEQPTTLHTTGSGGDRPDPDYPDVFQQHEEKGVVTLLITADSDGKAASVEVVGSSGFPALDRHTVEQVKRRWKLPTGSTTGHLFQVSITYKLE